MRKVLVWSIGIVMVTMIVVTIGSSFYMLDYSLSPNPDRKDTAACFREQFKKYPICIECAVPETAQHCS